MKRQENVGLGNFSGHLEIFHCLLTFLSKKSSKKITLDFEAAIDLKASKRTEKVVNSLPCDLIKSCKVTAAQKVGVERKSSG